MPRWSIEDLVAYEKKRGIAGEWSGARPIVQEQQDGGAGTVDDQPEVSAGDGRDHPRFRVTVEVRISDRRRRDLDGALATLLDCLVAAGRQLAMDTGDNGKRREGEQGRRGRKNNH